MHVLPVTARPVGDLSRPYDMLHKNLKKLGFEEEKGQLREWMTVARDRSAWDGKLNTSELPPGSFTNLRRH
jgi:2'-5' RNA ligase